MDKPERISAAEFGQAVQEGVRAAAKRRKLDLRTSLGSDYYTLPWWIVGRQVRDVDLKVAHEFAVQVTEAVQTKSGIELSPALTMIDGDILVGFIERFGNEIEVPQNRLGRQQF